MQKPIPRRSLIKAALSLPLIMLGLLSRAGQAKPQNTGDRQARPFDVTLPVEKPLTVLAKFDVAAFDRPGAQLRFATGYVTWQAAEEFAAFDDAGRQLPVKRCGDKVCVLATE